MKNASKKKKQPNNDPKLHLNMSFEEAIKLSITTPFKKGKVSKKK